MHTLRSGRARLRWAPRIYGVIRLPSRALLRAPSSSSRSETGACEVWTWVRTRNSTSLAAFRAQLEPTNPASSSPWGTTFTRMALVLITMASSASSTKRFTLMHLSRFRGFRVLEITTISGTLTRRLCTH